MSRPTRDGTAKSVSQDQILRHARGQGIIHFPCSADHEQDWQPYPVDPYSAICDGHTYIQYPGFVNRDDPAAGATPGHWRLRLLLAPWRHIGPHSKVQNEGIEVAALAL